MKNIIPFRPEQVEGGEPMEGGGKVLEFRKKIAEETPEPGMELKENIEVKISGEDLHGVLVGLTHERNALKKQMQEIEGDPELMETFGTMVQGLLEKNADLISRLSSLEPTLEKHFKRNLE